MHCFILLFFDAKRIEAKYAVMAIVFYTPLCWRTLITGVLSPIEICDNAFSFLFRGLYACVRWLSIHVLGCVFTVCLLTVRGSQDYLDFCSRVSDVPSRFLWLLSFSFLLFIYSILNFWHLKYFTLLVLLTSATMFCTPGNKKEKIWANDKKCKRKSRIICTYKKETLYCSVLDDGHFSLAK